MQIFDQVIATILQINENNDFTYQCPPSSVNPKQNLHKENHMKSYNNLITEKWMTKRKALRAVHHTHKTNLYLQ